MGQTTGTGDGSTSPDGRDEIGAATSLAGASAETLATYRRLAPLCLQSLVASFDADRHLFSRQLLDGAWTEVDATYPHETLTSSCIALIGLARSANDPAAHGIDTERCIDAIIGEVRRTGYVAGIGLALWANAVVGGRRSAGALLDAAGLSLAALPHAVRSFTTMETAWCASGLLHELHRSPADDEGAAAVTHATVAIVEELRVARCDHTYRLMVHAGPGGHVVDRLRGHIANFADQIYSVQALAFAGIVLGDTRAAEAGAALADRHCDLQGELGQWWWHYDARRGHVALRYAVYSVHQHGMAPMALAATTAAGGGRYSDAIDASVGWIDRNEIGVSLVDEEHSTIWRNIDRADSRLSSRVRAVGEMLGHADERDGGVLAINRETRPYEWGWCLYAGAIATGMPPGGSIA
ncbi:MAG: hypothetical protein U0Q22_09155 [Acidimicrobiales bacterium]